MNAERTISTKILGSINSQAPNRPHRRKNKSFHKIITIMILRKALVLLKLIIMLITNIAVHQKIQILLSNTANNINLITAISIKQKILIQQKATPSNRIPFQINQILAIINNINRHIPHHILLRSLCRMVGTERESV